jgi:hypothetical protein
MPSIFICYRRQDTSGYAGRLHDVLVPAVGRESVFMDIDTLRPGVDFAAEIRDTLARTDVVLVLIGPHWANARDDVGSRRLDDPNDYVRQEIATAVRGGVRIVPVLVGGSHLPKRDTLAEEIRPLTERHAVELSDRRWHEDTMRLIESLNEPPLHDEPDSRVGNRPVNLGFDGATDNGLPHGWFNSVGHVSFASDRYEVHTVRRGRGACLMFSCPQASPDEFGSLMQRFPAAFLAGSTVQLEGELRTESVSGWAGLWIRADGDETPNIVFDNMHQRGPRGTEGWARHSLEVKLPRNTKWLNIGLVLSGPGTLWADDLHLRVWQKDGRWADV